MITKVTFLEAARMGTWIRRRGKTKIICVSETPTNLYNMTRSDFLAEDWELSCDEEPAEEVDSSSVRFMMIELE